MRNALTAFLTTSALLAAGSASAGTQQTTFTVTATVMKNCTTATATNFTFPAYTPTTGAVTSTSTVSIACTNKTPFNVGLDPGKTSGSSIAQRLLNDLPATDTLQYNLYTDATYTTPVGTTVGTNTIPGTGQGMAKQVVTTINGQLLDSGANQAVPTGTYTDTITVTVTF